jgi:hypothetical protein
LWEEFVEKLQIVDFVRQLDANWNRAQNQPVPQKVAPIDLNRLSNFGGGLETAAP